MSAAHKTAQQVGYSFQREAGFRFCVSAQSTAVFSFEFPYTANGNGIVNGSGSQFASLVPGVPLHERKPIPGVAQTGTIQWLNPNAFVSIIDPSTGTCAGGDMPQTCEFGNLGRNALRGPDFTWSDLYLTKWFALTERVKLRIDGQFFNLFNHEFWSPFACLCRHCGKCVCAKRLWGAHVNYFAADRLARRWLGRRWFPAHDRFSSTNRVLAACGNNLAAFSQRLSAQEIFQSPGPEDVVLSAVRPHPRIRSDTDVRRPASRLSCYRRKRLGTQRKEAEIRRLGYLILAGVTLLALLLYPVAFFVARYYDEIEKRPLVHEK